ncbi:MAG TPA: TIGR00730 family Rossman fold protein [Chitinophagales bacterium]|nr:TIGR00730 family Rossman fold protein [Chitinophagales bacterium]HMW13703.1 TIGR00730 family Rossman fold protein [Chitinophagales bacterium]HMX60573.1 TIGR00730 family Rossman fold protein [Chitinophagales bacterium]HMY24558.1 TIGR00730 family Rossman fold protein [Chitinophagales bacterium]HMZ33984.1 TIGR00730 family Rossman fold protein [Chitinophagales bacterium]
MKKITVYCGANAGNEIVFEEQAFLLGKTLAQQQIGLVFGGGKVGLMGIVANGAIQHGGEVIGVIPHFLCTKEIAHDGVTEMISVDTMHQRKTILYELSDAMIALPGGFGTMEELFEMLTWAQLGLHHKPIALLNTNGFYDALLAFIQTMVDTQFLKKEYQQMLLHSDNIDDLLEKIRNYEAPKVTKWINKENT